MIKNAEITLKITSAGLNRFCQEIATGSSNTQRKHAAFMALEAFVTRHAGSDAYNNAYNQIQEIIGEFSTETRAQLLAENASDLTSALIQQDTKEIARIFSSVSRNGFGQILDESQKDLDFDQLQIIKPWINDWCSSAKHMAEKASGYPDAMNFRNTDIDLLEYTAMSEINTILRKA